MSCMSKGLDLIFVVVSYNFDALSTLAYGRGWGEGERMACTACLHVRVAMFLFVCLPPANPGHHALLHRPSQEALGGAAPNLANHLQRLNVHDVQCRFGSFLGLVAGLTSLTTLSISITTRRKHRTSLINLTYLSQLVGLISC
jgi:hypothetical protein